MTRLDTNTLVRYTVHDDQRPSLRATRLIESLNPHDPGFVPVVLATRLRSKELVLTQTLKRDASGGADFADALIERPSRAAGCPAMTFDADAVKAAAMTSEP